MGVGCYVILLFQACLKYVEERRNSGPKVLDDTLTTELLSLSATLVASEIVSLKQREVPLLSAYTNNIIHNTIISCQ